MSGAVHTKKRWNGLGDSRQFVVHRLGVSPTFLQHRDGAAAEPGDEIERVQRLAF